MNKEIDIKLAMVILLLSNKLICHTKFPFEDYLQELSFLNEVEKNFDFKLNFEENSQYLPNLIFLQHNEKNINSL